MLDIHNRGSFENFVAVGTLSLMITNAWIRYFFQTQSVPVDANIDENGDFLCYL